MSVSEVDIVNSALVKIGEDTITSLTDDLRQARFANRQYPLKRAELLRSYRWNFAMRRASLAPDATTPLFGFENRFLLPFNCLRMVGLFDEAEMDRNYTSTKKPWKIEGRYVLANASSIKIFYIEDVTATGDFDPLFIEALAWLLAKDLAYALSTGPRMVQMTDASFRETMRQAKLADAIEGTPEVMEASEWVDSRYAGGPHRIGPVVGY
jgi:hypothetical protein